jgi:hypothetical protein
MTAQIFLNILRHSFLKMGSVGLLILDECHHAVKKHPYSLIMQEFYHPAPPEQRPTIFGMTASPVNLKGEGLQDYESSRFAAVVLSSAPQFLVRRRCLFSVCEEESGEINLIEKGGDWHRGVRIAWLAGRIRWGHAVPLHHLKIDAGELRVTIQEVFLG